MKSPRKSVGVTLGAIFLISWNLYLTMQTMSPSSLPQHLRTAAATAENDDSHSSSNMTVTTAHRDAGLDTDAPSPSGTPPRTWTTPLTDGVDPIYLQLLDEAERRSLADYDSSHTKGAVGIVIGPTDGRFLSHTLLALRSARRMRNMLLDQSIRLALATTPEHIRILQTQCNGDDGTAKTTEYEETCRLWANNTLFDDVVPIVDEYQWNDNHTKSHHVPSRYWLKSLGSYKHAPYKLSLVLDSDAFTCPGFERLFQIATPRQQDVWQLMHQGQTDFAAGIDQFPFGTGLNGFLLPGDRQLLRDFHDFPERNTGTMLFSFHRPLAHTFAHFVPLVAEYIWNHKSSAKHEIVNDQAPFRVAVYLFKRLRPEFVEQQIPQHACCRTYPGNPHSGTHPENSRMLPLLEDGSRCNDCLCTPCLVAHFSEDVPIPVQGRTGYEEDFRLVAPYQYP